MSGAASASEKVKVMCKRSESEEEARERGVACAAVTVQMSSWYCSALPLFRGRRRLLDLKSAGWRSPRKPEKVRHPGPGPVFLEHPPSPPPRPGCCPRVLPGPGHHLRHFCCSSKSDHVCFIQGFPFCRSEPPDVTPLSCHL